jgi:hypothetical protein
MIINPGRLQEMSESSREKEVSVNLGYKEYVASFYPTPFDNYRGGKVNI